jgi:hypothetical protein
MMNDTVPATTTAVQEIDGTNVCFSFGTLLRGFIKHYELTVKVPSVEIGLFLKIPALDKVSGPTSNCVIIHTPLTE